MTWHPYLLELQLESSLAVGPGWRLGFVELTRLEIPPRTFWGAFTDALGRYCLSDRAKAEELGLDSATSTYREIGEWLASRARFLPGILVLKEGETEKERLVPAYRFGEGMAFRKKNGHGKWEWADPDACAADYTQGKSGTALTYDLMSADEGMLHDTERITPLVERNGHLYEVWLETVIFVKDSLTLSDWISGHARQYLKIGRDITYGDGTFKKEIISPITNYTDMSANRDLMFINEGIQWILNEDDAPVITITPGKKSLNKEDLIHLPGPFLSQKTPNKITGYWGKLRRHIIRNFDVKRKMGFGAHCGYPANTPQWILEHGGILATDNAEPRNFSLLQDGWWLKEGNK